MKRRTIWILAGLLLLPGLASAETENFEIDKGHSRIGFGVKHMLVSTVRGEFLEYSGMARIDVADPLSAEVEVVIHTDSVNTNQERRDEHLRSDDFFNAEEYPEITFRSKRVEQQGDGLLIVGDLTIRDTTKEVIMPVEVAGPIQDPWGNTRMGVSGELTIDRTEFGLSYNNTLETGGLVVGHDVKIQIDVELVQSKS